MTLRQIVLRVGGVALLAAGCAASPTEPRTAELEKWEGEPVIETALRCDPAGARQCEGGRRP